MLTTDKILAHKIDGKNLILLTQVASSYFLVFGQIVRGKKGNSFKTVLQKELTQAEAFAVHAQLTGANASSGTAGESVAACADSSNALLLESPKQAAKAFAKPISYKIVRSPYFPSSEMLLTRQKPRAPSSFF